MKIKFQNILVGWALTTSALAADHGNLRRRAAADYDCVAGCSLKRQDMGPPVCGVDGITYYNECLAVCQDIEVEKNGACPGDPPEMNSELYDEDGVVDLDTMKRFKSEKFKLVSKRKTLPFEENFSDNAIDDPPEPDDQEEEPGDGNGGKGSQGNGNGGGGGNGNGGSGGGGGGNGNGGNGKGKIRAFRLSNERFEYVADLDESEVEDPDDLSPADPIVEDGENRKLGIYKSDTRSQVTNVFAWPNMFVGEMDYGTGEGGCSGTVISRNSVLTAGHCVHSGPGGSWLNHNTFAPARYRTSSGSTVEPYGEFVWSHMTTYSTWTQKGYRSYDMAVIQYNPRSGYYIGEWVGYAGLRSTYWSSSALDACRVKGYPYDKPDGQMWTSGPCSPGFTWDWSFYRTKHYCDTVGANSGSALMDTAGYVSGVHVAGRYTSGDQVSSNVGVLLYGRNYDKAKEWSGR